MNNKLIKVVFGILLGIASTVSALEYETIITPEAPGFFAITIFNDIETEHPQCSQTIIVKNFANSEKKKYQKLLENNTIVDIYCQNKPQIIMAQDLKKKQPASYNDVIVLGKPLGVYPNFSLQKSHQSQFKFFIEQHVQPRIISFFGINIEHDDNVFDIRTNRKELNNQEALIISGKFKRKIMSNLHILGKNISNNFPVQIEIPINFANEELANDPLAKDLSNIWEALGKQNKQQKIQKPSFFTANAYSRNGNLAYNMHKNIF